MPKLQTIAQGEHLSQLAEDNAFRTFKTIWSDGANADLAAKRDPHVLAVGDQIAIPDFRRTSMPRPVDQTHKFVAASQKLFLKARLLNVDGTELSGAQCDIGLDLADGVVSADTDDDGKVEQRIERKTRTGEILAHPTPPKDGDAPDPVKFDLRIGHLNPGFKMSGQQARLNNMGYFAGYTLRDLDQFLWAVEEFECEAKKRRVTARPTLIAAPAAGEDDGADDPDTPTGVQEPDLRDLITSSHGI